jgi:hypothetical protein
MRQDGVTRASARTNICSLERAFCLDEILASVEARRHIDAAIDVIELAAAPHADQAR